MGEFFLKKKTKQKPKSPFGQETHLEVVYRASLLVQWLRMCLPMQGKQVRALAREDPTFRGATKPVRHNY